MEVIIPAFNTPTGVGISQELEWLVAVSPCCSNRLMGVDIKGLQMWSCPTCPWTVVAPGNLSSAFFLAGQSGAAPLVEKWVSLWTGYPVSQLAAAVSW